MGPQKLEIPDLEMIDLKNGVPSATIGLSLLTGAVWVL